MKTVDITSLTDLESATKYIVELEQRLLKCEDCLSDIARSAELTMITGQFHLLQSFIDAANQMLEDRLTLDQAESKIDNITIIQA